MFRAIISPFLRSTDCVYSFCYNAPTMLPAGNPDELELTFHLVQLTSRQHRQCIIPQAVNTVCAPEEGRNYRPKHFELIGIINKPLLLHLFWLFMLLYLWRAVIQTSKRWTATSNILFKRRTKGPSITNEAWQYNLMSSILQVSTFVTVTTECLYTPTTCLFLEQSYLERTLLWRI